MRKKITTASAILFCLLILGIFISWQDVRGYSQTNESGLPAVLITEIRELRRALQDFAVTGQRVQIALEQIRMQQEVVERLQGEISSYEAQQEIYATEMLQVEESAKALERLIGMENDSMKRVQLETERKNALIRLEDAKKRQAALHEKQTQIQATLMAEKNQLAEAKSKVEELDKQMDAQAARRK